MFTPRACHISHVTCHMSNVTCYIVCVMCHGTFPAQFLLKHLKATTIQAKHKCPESLKIPNTKQSQNQTFYFIKTRNQLEIQNTKKRKEKKDKFTTKKNPAYGIQSISQPMRIVALIQKNPASKAKFAEKKNFFLCGDFTPSIS